MEHYISLTFTIKKMLFFRCSYSSRFAYEILALLKKTADNKSEGEDDVNQHAFYVRGYTLATMVKTADC